MPCQSYDTNWARTSTDRDIKRLKAEADKLARIACKALEALEDMGKEDFLLLKDDEVRDWWKAHKIADAQARAAAEEKERRKEAKARAMSKLTADLLIRETLDVARAGVEYGDGMEDAVYKYFGVEE